MSSCSLGGRKNVTGREADEMTAHTVGTRKEWLAARTALLAKEKEHFGLRSIAWIWERLQVWGRSFSSFLIFEDYCERGMGLGEICDKLNRDLDRYPPPTRNIGVDETRSGGRPQAGYSGRSATLLTHLVGPP
jgi:hypothetical protein